MAASMQKGHVDSSVNERRIRLIYEYLDNGNNKKALQESEKVLKKTPSFQCARVLKALALLRLSRKAESEIILNEVRSEVPVEEHALQAMSLCYKDLHQMDLICNLYEAAVAKDPTNEEFHTHLFMAYVRVGNYTKQKQTAINLYKVKPKKPYYLWAVMSIVMQAKEKPSIAKTVTLPLAEKMIMKFVDSNKIESEAEVQLYLMILELQEKYSEALNLINSDLGKSLSSHPNLIDFKRCEYLSKQKDWSQLSKLLEELLNKNVDQWLYYKMYYETLFSQYQELCDSSSKKSLFDKTLNFIDSVISKSKTLGRIRGPNLAKLEFFKRWQDKFNESLTDEFQKLILDYYYMFGDCHCCFSDLKPYLLLLSPEQTKSLLSTVGGDNARPISEITTIKDLNKYMFYHYLNRYIGYDSPDRESLIALYHSCHQLYQNIHNLSEGLLPTDLRPNDYLGLFCGHIALDLWKLEHDDMFLLDACIILENLLEMSPSNHHFKLLLCRAYSCLGAVTCSFGVYENLDIKYVQNDTLGYLVTQDLFALGRFSCASSLYSSILNFFTVNYNEGQECLISSYKAGSFSKIQEFVSLRERLMNSLQYSLITVERLFLNLILNNDSHEATYQAVLDMEMDLNKGDIPFDQLLDNRDFNLMLNWDPPSRQFEESEVNQLFVNDKIYLQLRSELLYCIATAVLMCQEKGCGTDQENQICNQNGNMSDSENQKSRNFSTSLSKFKESVSIHTKEGIKHNVPNRIIGPFPSRLECLLSDTYLDTLLNYLEVCSCMCDMIDKDSSECLSSDKSQIMIEQASEAIQKLVARHCALLEDTKSTLHNMLGYKSAMYKVVCLIECLNYAVIIFGVIHNTMKPIRVRLNKRSRKKKDTNPINMPPIFEDLNRLKTLTTSSLEVLHNCLSEFPKSYTFQLDEKDEIGLLALVSRKNVLKKIFQSYDDCLSECLTSLSQKIKHIKSLK